MDYYFISDDGYFLEGIGQLKFVSERRASFVHVIHHSATFRLKKATGVVVIKVTDIKLCNSILRAPSLAGCRVIMLLNPSLMPNGFSRNHFPWCIPSNIGENELSYILSRAERTPLTKISIPDIGRWMFWCLGMGHSLSFIAESTGFSVKYLHGLKLRIMRRCGLTGGHARGVLYCRDLAAMHQQRLPGRRTTLKDISEGQEARISR